MDYDDVEGGAGGSDMVTGRAFGREALLDALDRIGSAAVRNATMLDIAIYGGSALMLASNFRYATEDVAMAQLDGGWPDWLSAEVATIAQENDWSPDWLNDAVQFHLSALADLPGDHVEFGTFPREGPPGLRVHVPSLDYMIALKLKAMRINDPEKGPVETSDIQKLLLVRGVGDVDEAIAIMGKYFPKSAREPDAQSFFLRHIWPEQDQAHVTAEYPRGHR